MDFVSEEIIDGVASVLGQSEENMQSAIEELQENQPVIAAYIFSENFDLLTQIEKEYFLFLTTILFKSIQQLEPTIATITEEQLGTAEEKNWAMLSEVKAKKFRERMDVFFEKYEQEDLLAFVEDSLTAEEEDMITKVGREPMFVALKSIIDALTN